MGWRNCCCIWGCWCCCTRCAEPLSSSSTRFILSNLSERSSVSEEHASDDALLPFELDWVRRFSRTMLAPVEVSSRLLAKGCFKTWSRIRSITPRKLSFGTHVQEIYCEDF